MLEHIRSDILEGKIPAGSELNQSVLAERYGVSRIPVRDALQALAAEKLIVMESGKSARVIRLTRQEIEELIETRILLECNLLTHAIELATPEHLAEVEYEFRKSSIEAGRPGWAVGDWNFHKAMYSASRRSRQIEIVQELRQCCAIHAPRYADLALQTARWLDDHQALLDAYKAHDVKKACSILLGHIRGSGELLIEFLQNGNSG